MSEESLSRLLDRLGADAQLVERLKANPGEALGEYDLSPTERMALATNDEDGLRRLAGLDVSGFMVGGTHLSILCPVQVTLGCGTIYVCSASPSCF